MKHVFSFSLLVLAVAVITSCSESEDFTPSEPVDARADSPLLVTSPTEVYFNDVELFTEVYDTINIKTAGLSSMAVLTNFDIAIQGNDAGFFRFQNPQVDLVSLLTALMGGGVNIPVSYQPLDNGTHEAELLITTTLLGVLMPVQITIPLHGSTMEVPIPQLVSTIPENRGTVEFDGQVPGSEYIGKGQYHLDFIFDMNVAIAPRTAADGFQFGNTTTAAIVNREVVNGNTVRLTVWEDFTVLYNTVLILPNTIISADAPGFRNIPGNSLIRFSYEASSEIPDNYIDE